MARRTDDPQQSRLPSAGVPTSGLPASPAAGGPLQTADDHLLTQESFRAILSSHQRAGRWEAADEIEVRAIFGEVTLDFTRADLPPSGIIEIEALAFCGEIKIIVPEGAEIELNGTPIVGSIEQQVHKRGAGERIRGWVTGERDDQLRAASDSSAQPYFRVDGRAIFGTIRVIGR
jgi:hypothetical protein